MNRFYHPNVWLLYVPNAAGLDEAYPMPLKTEMRENVIRDGRNG